MLKIKFVRTYKKLDKNNKLFTMFVYAVQGTEEQLEAYATAQGDNLVTDDEGNHLFFSRDRFVGATNTLVANQAGDKYFADMSSFDKASSLCAQYGEGAFGKALAEASIAQLLGSIGLTANTPVATKAPAVEKETDISQS